MEDDPPNRGQSSSAISSTHVVAPGETSWWPPRQVTPAAGSATQHNRRSQAAQVTRGVPPWKVRAKVDSPPRPSGSRPALPQPRHKQEREAIGLSASRIGMKGDRLPTKRSIASATCLTCGLPSTCAVHRWCFPVTINKQPSSDKTAAGQVDTQAALPRTMPTRPSMAAPRSATPLTAMPSI